MQQPGDASPAFRAGGADRNRTLRGGAARARAGSAAHARRSAGATQSKHRADACAGERPGDRDAQRRRARDRRTRAGACREPGGRCDSRPGAGRTRAAFRAEQPSGLGRAGRDRAPDLRAAHAAIEGNSGRAGAGRAARSAGPHTAHARHRPPYRKPVRDVPAGPARTPGAHPHREAGGNGPHVGGRRARDPQPAGCHHPGQRAARRRSRRPGAPPVDAMVQQNAQRLARIVDEVLDVARARQQRVLPLGEQLALDSDRAHPRRGVGAALAAPGRADGARGGRQRACASTSSICGASS